MSKIAAHGDDGTIADLLQVLRTATATPSADELRFHCAVAVQQLASDAETQKLIEQLCAADPYWRCKVLAGLEAEPDPDQELERLAASLKYPSSWP